MGVKITRRNPHRDKSEYLKKIGGRNNGKLFVFPGEI